MSSKTPLHAAHVDAGGKMVDFAGWELPIHYGSQMEEHRAVREAAGMFDVSHMTVVDIRGSGARNYLRHLLANDVAKLKEKGQALYGCMLNEKGGVIDDLITYWLDDDFYRTVVNAATRENDLAWMRRAAADFDVEISERDDLAMVAVQGPEAREKVIDVLGATHAESLKPFRATTHGDYFIARTGYTGEDGFEVLLPTSEAEGFWKALLNAGVQPCGLGARDSLRLEAGLNLYGQDMDTTTTPLESNLGWTVAFEPDDRDFIGRAPLEKQKEDGVPRQLVGLVLGRGGIPRSGATVHTAAGEGQVTSGVFGPTTQCPVALARIPAGEFDEVEVELRGRRLTARVVKPPFVRQGKVRI
ncbi:MULTISPECIES: glycine cleavage system aminomethyltransferase GcvT [unclassified Wenzhouxiangella]|uniref:glycine cleavage system aminomethyltransferase GcvT n=1 Tax=unclassified Wenzhouxiangella TaxID=2613841 RepID=UPI000E32C37E|nr:MULTISPECIES: glycine cleavage system aminomethyltransferase GcvT [unclassified Wenzhouxiangella]RFF27112.1 glycine cleavage system aminomethyltransferase GcvT [Wenzhouxiangella sp. 15181]RFP69202.1 glycine cleavage system aminomethyltransferase GcvT [Wenzhouxiangella sp. 15190]